MVLADRVARDMFFVVWVPNCAWILCAADALVRVMVDVFVPVKMLFLFLLFSGPASCF